ncbi:hypothetical protein M0R89_11420 [Halorussus limi]|uniref:Uncharacterized protein n=1 Tax=Halorussus limi TaxID=2938695 RepID=A0A8U0HQJ6_9EURY|nr:hypothetical protein [Halorussus limi]UPV73157.1 hypothetical protein M0R89_11420 [Halorussus limi]
MNGRRGRGRDGPSEGTVLRLALLAAIVAVPGVQLFGTDALRESAGALRTGQTSQFAPVLAGGILLVGAALAVRAGWSQLRSDGESVETGVPDETRPCRICGRNLDPYRSRCPHCDTREPVEDR